MKPLLALPLIGFGLAVAVPLAAQDQMSAEQQRDWFVQFVEGQLSTPERQIRISNIDGLLSQQASIREVTISDADGLWLRIVNAAIDWDQGALFSGRLQIRSLTADSIEFLRPGAQAAADPSLPAPEAGPVQIPEFPIAIVLEQLSVPRVTFGDSVFGLGSEIAVEGSFKLEGGSLDSALDITRLDGPGGNLTAEVAFANADDTLDLKLALNEPPNGIIANLLNIEGRPDIALTVEGAGPVTELRTEMALLAGGEEALSGLATISQTGAGLEVTADLGGPMGRLVAVPYQPFFGAESALTARAVVRPGGGLDIPQFRLSGGQLQLDATASTTADGFLNRLSVDAGIADPAGQRVVLPVPGAATTIAGARLRIDYGGDAGEAWTADVSADAFANGAITAQTVAFTASGIASDIDDPVARRLTFNGDGTISGIAADDPDVGAALGDSVGFGVAGLWNAGSPIQLAQLRLVGEAVELGLSGAIDAFVFDGDIAIAADSIAPFSGMAGRELAGGLALDAKGTLSPLIGGFDLVLDGTGSNLQLSEPALDKVLAGDVRLSGRLARTETGITAEDFALGNANVQIAADGTFASSEADFRFNFDLADLALVSGEAQGALNVTGTARGSGTVALDLKAGVASGALAGRPVRDAAFGFAGTLAEDGTLRGALSGNGVVDAVPVLLAGDVLSSTDSRQISGLRFEAGPTRLTGEVTQDAASGLVTGALDLQSSDISTAAALLLVEATGSANAAIRLGAADGRQNAEVTGSLARVRAAGVAVGSAEIAATMSDLFGVPVIDGTVNGRDIAAQGVTINTLSGRASQSGSTTTFTLDAGLANNAQAALAGSLAPLEGGYRLALDRADLRQGTLAARLAQPAALTLAGSRVTLEPMRFDVGGGSVTASGTAGEALDIAVALEALPLTIANAVVPSLGLAGTVRGTGQIGGSASDPRASFALEASGINAAAISAFGIAPVSLSARGSFAGQAVTLENLTANGAGGLTMRANGRVPLAGNGVALSLEGSAPLAFANRFVAERGGQLSGTAQLSASVAGSLASPQLSGTVSTAGAGYIDPELNLRLNDITGNARLAGDRVVVESLTAGLATGGTLAVSGSVGLGAGNPAEIALRLNSARYADGNLFVATVSGDLGLSGPLTGSPLLSGRLMVEKADITVPDGFGGGAALIDVEHVASPAPVAATLARAGGDQRASAAGAASPSVVRLDVTVDAPNQIFVRGRGLDAEVGGSLRLTGNANNIVPVGGFSLNRGRLAILGQRITFEEGAVTLVGDLDPYLDFLARTEGNGIEVFVNVAGRASELAVTFSSSPALPQDEVLARLLFGRSMGELSPMQLARLAGAAAELAGGSNPSLVDSLRERAGLADLNVVTGEDGNLAVQAGQYLQDNIYLGVTAGANGQTRVSVDLDITDDLRARASTGVDGESSVGVFFEKDY